ncbi:MAG: DNA ligase, partial [Pseudomonadota bacterium]|nr:DNA ligase [Pseudomonadota bacterium]
LSRLTQGKSISAAKRLSMAEPTADDIAAAPISDKRWAKIRFMAFDMPVADQPFDSRLNKLNSLKRATPNPTFAVIPQFKLLSLSALEEELKQVTKNGGEGLMLHHGNAFYQTGRSDNLLKVKHFEDAEAKVLAQLPGKGKFKGMMGSLLVETSDGIRFKLGTGFSNKERQAPPAVGSWVTFKYYGVTKNGKPRFASFLRTRPVFDLSK